MFRKFWNFLGEIKYRIVDVVMLFVAFLLSVFVRVFFLFVPTKYVGGDVLKQYLKEKGPVILVFWHGRSIYVIKFWLSVLGFRNYPIYGIFSTHRDGKFMGRVLGFLGVKKIPTDKGDAEQGKKAAIKSLKILHKGYSLGFTPDGPVGPRMNFVTDSAFLFAKASGAPIVPVYASSEKAKILNTWDRYMIAKPFHKTVVSVGDFLFISKKVSDADFKKIKSDFEKKMVFDTQKLDKKMKMAKIEPDDGTEKIERYLVKLKKWGVAQDKIEFFEKLLIELKKKKESLDKHNS